MYLCYVLHYYPFLGIFYDCCISWNVYNCLLGLIFDGATKTIKLPYQDCKYQLPTFKSVLGI